MSKQTKKFSNAIDELEVATKKLKAASRRLEKLEDRIASLEARGNRDPSSCRYLDERTLVRRLNVSVKYLQKPRCCRCCF